MKSLSFLLAWRKVFLIIASLLLLYCCVSTFPLPLPNRKPDGVYHTVRKKETLWRICKTYNVAMQEVAELNNIKSTSQIKAGDKIFIPDAKKILKVPTKQKEPDHSTQKISQQKGMFKWPLKGSVVAEFGVYQGRKHDGIDIAAPVDSSVKASCSGKVVFAAKLKGYGNTIIIQHTQNYATVYANNRLNLVKKGQWVAQGQEIAKVGIADDGGKSPHLHFQIRKKNRPRNPLFYLPNNQ